MPAAVEVNINIIKGVRLNIFQGAAGIFVGYPFDTVKVLMQTQNSGKEQKYFTTFQCMGRVRREEGVMQLSQSESHISHRNKISRISSQFLRLYRGLYTPLCTVALTNAVTFGVYGIMSRNMGNETTADITRNGIVAGTVRAFVISPIEVVKIQQQVHPSRTLSQVATEVWQKAGLRGFGRGFTTTLTRYFD